MKLGSLIFGLLMLGMFLVFVGMEIGYRQRDAEMKVVTLTKTCPDPHFKPAWECGATEAKTYCTTCLRRKWL